MDYYCPTMTTLQIYNLVVTLPSRVYIHNIEIATQ